MRVIAGRLGGRRLRAPVGRVTRPTSDRVKEAVFAMLDDVEGLRVLDLFAGTGALGIEALSRGAQAAVFIERDAAVVRVLNGNLAALELTAELAQVRRSDALEALRGAASRQETYDLIFIDPPYGRARAASSAAEPPVADRWGPQLSAILPSLLSPGARVVIESDRRAPIELPHGGAGGIELERRKRYGDTLITIHRQQ
jgi:16S rRNA (guanine966-N2)-methyltransferase